MKNKSSENDQLTAFLLISPEEKNGKTTLPQNALRRDCNGKCIEVIEGHYLEVVVLL